MSTIIAMGGGAPEEQQLVMRQRIVAETGKVNPRVLYIPTDGGETIGFWPFFKLNFEALGGQVQPLFLLRDHASRSSVGRLIEDADLIFVGGGNTLRMMRMWRRFGVDRLLIEASRSDKVLAGVSAGAICWFEYGHSDSRSFSGKPDWPYIRVRGLGIVNGTFCPHVLGEKRLENFQAMMRKFGGVGYGVNDGTALLIKNGVAEGIGERPEVFRVTQLGCEPVSGPFPVAR